MSLCDCRYAECRFAECHYVDCRGAKMLSSVLNNKGFDFSDKVVKDVSSLISSSSECVSTTNNLK
jgi:hypothetical protein